MKAKSLVFIKIGGSLITDKTKPYTLNEKALDIICEEVKRAQGLGKALVVGHGHGSFGHIAIKKYQTNKGIINDESYRGIVEVADVAAHLNRIVMKKLIEKDVNAVSVSPLSMMIAENHRLVGIWTKSFEEIVRLGILPVVYGDQIFDRKIGCTVFSTEKVLGYIAVHLKNIGYHVERIIHCGKTNGVYNANGKTIPVITPRNLKRYHKVISGSHGIDATGGMEHKVEETLALAKQGIPGLIIDGIEQGSLSKAVAGEQVLGTRIEA